MTDDPAPKHLSPQSQFWWKEIVATYDFSAFELHTLQRACETWDAMEHARAIIFKEGPIIPGRSGTSRVHPAHAILRDSTILWMKLCKSLGLPDSGPK